MNSLTISCFSEIIYFIMNSLTIIYFKFLQISLGMIRYKWKYNTTGNNTITYEWTSWKNTARNSITTRNNWILCLATLCCFSKDNFRHTTTFSQTTFVMTYTNEITLFDRYLFHTREPSMRQRGHRHCSLWGLWHSIHRFC